MRSGPLEEGKRVSWQRDLVLRSTSVRVPAFWLVGSAVVLGIGCLALNWRSSDTGLAVLFGVLCGILYAQWETSTLRAIVDEQSAELAKTGGAGVPPAREPAGRTGLIVVLGGAIVVVTYALWLRWTSP
jgi:hypothetical protein